MLMTFVCESEENLKISYLGKEKWPVGFETDKIVIYFGTFATITWRILITFL